MVSWHSKKLGDVLLLANGLVILVLINILSSMFFFRADLTDEKRYSVKAPTKKLLRSLDDDVYVEVYLEGDINAGFKRFQKAIRETLDEFGVYSGNRVRYAFVNPLAATGEKARTEFMQSLAAKGIQPTRVFDKKDGNRIEKLIFPGAVVSYGGAEVGVNLLKSSRTGSHDEKINQAMESIEFELANAIHTLTNESPARIGLVTGQGEMEGPQAAAFTAALREAYQVTRVSLLDDLTTCDVLVIAKPTTPFTEAEKYRLDQYIMQRGNVLFMLDKLDASIDSAARQDYFAFPYNLNLDDQLFRYGVRLNPDLVQDKVSGLVSIVTGQSGSKPEMQRMEWPFYPLVNSYAEHAITNNLDAVVLRFASSIDTVKAQGIKKTPLLFSSRYSRTVTAPVNVNIQALGKEAQTVQFTRSFIPLAYLLEGRFTSLFKNRFVPEGEDQRLFKAEGKPARIVVIADGDIASNGVNPRTLQPQPLGFDQATGYTFANHDLLLNAIAYLTDEEGLIKARSKQISIRPLDKERIVSEKLRWQIFNLAVPLVVVIAYGIVRAVIRKRRYASF